jgi:hypothetical protein
MHPQLRALAEELTRALPNLRVTGVNDPGHSATGGHYQNKAVDVALEQGHKYTQEELNTIQRIANEMGYKMINELSSRGGAHLHLQERKPEDTPELKSKKSSMAVPDYKGDDSKLATNAITTPNFTRPPENPDDKIIISKLDDLNTLFNRSLRIQEDILAHTKVLA